METEIPSHWCLPEEIIGEILSWLPVKSLLKFRCVSKSWRTLIGSKRFIKTHLQYSAKHPCLSRHKVILNSYSLNGRLEHSSLRSLLNETFTDSLKIADLMNIEWGIESVNLVGCCNGLVCVLLDRTKFVLWNPSTKMSKKLPEIDIGLQDWHITIYGFGFDESSGDYKVFWAVYFTGTDGRRLALGCLYSLQNNSWKKITVFGGNFNYDARGTFAGGNLHWEKGEDFGIVSFDLKNEVYGIVEEPSYGYSEVSFTRSLGVLDGCLSVLCDYQKTRFDFWVMKQYGVRESWDKVATLPCLLGLPKSPSCKPFCVGPNGEVLLTYLSNFVVYYPQTNGVRMINSVPFRHVDIYTGSLVSLLPDGEKTAESVA